jgi:uncharacterized membrane protein YkoI
LNKKDMPLRKAKGTSKKAVQSAVSSNIRELMKDNKKSGKARGAGGKVRPMKQILAIALSKARGK